PAVGEAFTMLTCPPGPDIVSYHDRQIVIVERRDWAGWLSGETPAAEICVPLPAGSLKVEPVLR
ncbi:MAG: SOS response-associated peptidase, partial [Sphingomonas sp.]